MMFGAVAASSVLFRPAHAYWDTRDTADDGSGFVADGWLDRVSGLSASAATAAERFRRDTALLGASKPLAYADIRDVHARCTSAGTFGGMSGTGTYSLVLRIRRISNGTGVWCSFGDGAGATVSNTILHQASNISPGTVTYRAQRSDGAATTNSDSPTTFTMSVDTWYTAAWTYDSSQIYRYYQNGVLTWTSAANTRAPAAITTFTMGNADAISTAGRAYFAGWKVWVNQVIDATQMLYEHNQFAAWAA